MKRTAIAAFVLLPVIAYTAGVWRATSRDPNSHNANDSMNTLRFSCPMHPEFHTNRDGTCPSCGMRLVASKRDLSAADPFSGYDGRISPGTIRISPEKQQILGIRTGKAERSDGSRTLRVVGRVAVDETRTYSINSAVAGWIRDISPNTVGSLVRMNQKLASYYAPEFLSPQQAYVYRLDALDQLHHAGGESPSQIARAEANIQDAGDHLLSLGMHDIQIEELRRTHQPAQKIGIYSPATGFVLKRNVTPGMHFEAGAEFYQIADLSRIWILADIFEDDAHLFNPGAPATVIYRQQKTTFPARVSDVLPQFDPATRTLEVRLLVDNSKFTLCPGMFVDVEFPVRLPSAITVPADAILDSGLRRTVFVDLGDGYFEPRRVQTGWRADDRVEITKGLMEGERVVVGGNFLVDSESRLNAAESALSGRNVEDPVCGMPIGARSVEDVSDFAGKTYRFCSARCKAAFDKSPTPFLNAAAREPAIVAQMPAAGN
jgi:Cu(I)/Ag(I) efflux system membrane fusion protein